MCILILRVTKTDDVCTIPKAERGYDVYTAALLFTIYIGHTLGIFSHEDL